MNLSTLDIFVDVMRGKSLSAVARHRQTTPSSVSRAIAALEAELGTRLFQRTTRSVAPTEAAVELLARIEPHLEGLRHAHEAIAETSGAARGALRVTASVSFGVQCIGPLLGEFARLHPALTLELHLTDVVVDLVADRFDLGIRHGPLPDSNLVAQTLIATRYFVCASPGYIQHAGRPQEPRDLRHHRCLVFPLPGFATTWRFRERFRERFGGQSRDAHDLFIEAAVSPSITVNSGLVLRQCALDGVGIALLSDWLIGDDLRSGRLVDLFPRHVVSPTSFDTAISAVYPSRKHVPRKVKLLIDFLQQRLGGGDRLLTEPRAPLETAPRGIRRRRST